MCLNFPPQKISKICKLVRKWSVGFNLSMKHKIFKPNFILHHFVKLKCFLKYVLKRALRLVVGPKTRGTEGGMAEINYLGRYGLALSFVVFSLEIIGKTWIEKHVHFLMF